METAAKKAIHISAGTAVANNHRDLSFTEQRAVNNGDQIVMGDDPTVMECQQNQEADLEEAVANSSAEENGYAGDVGPDTPRQLLVKDRREDADFNHEFSGDEDDGVPLGLSDDESGDVATEGLLPHGHRRRRSLEDLLAMYEHEGEWDDEDDDEDWEPSEWFCTNCTMPNADQGTFCELCGEHRKSGILKRGFLASMLIPEGTEVEKENEICQEGAGDKHVLPSLTSPFPISPSHPAGGLTAIGFDQRMLLHFEIKMKSRPHPERPDRLNAIMGGLAAAGLFPGRCFSIPAREATRAELESVHTHDHVDAVEESSGHELSYFTSDTYANSDSALAARLAAGVCIDLATTIIKGQALNGFALVRPPGHHAMQSTVMGFCLHNNAAIAAKAALAAGAKKILIVDWDVHHGNGTQEIFNSDSSVLYISLHRHEGGLFYPGTGAAIEVGCDEGEGFSVNIPWGCGGIGDEDYLFAFQQIVLPIATQFSPDMTVISAGFDAAKGDPLGGCAVTPLGYAHMAQMLSSLAQGRMLVVLEGGYNLRSISASAAAVMKVLLGEAPGPLPVDYQPTRAGLAAVLEVCQIQARYWKVFPMPILRMSSQLAASDARQKGNQGNKQVNGGPVWWKWGRKRLVYDHWFAT